MQEKPIETLQEQRDTLIEQLHAAYSRSPSTTFQAYRKAQKALQTQEELTFSDDEIARSSPKKPSENRSGLTREVNRPGTLRSLTVRTP
jgi:hypothetical protein